jgi:hypothetical protein
MKNSSNAARQTNIVLVPGGSGNIGRQVVGCLAVCGMPIRNRVQQALGREPWVR